MDYRVLTVSREFGSGGGRIAQSIAKRLGWKLLDGALIDEIASPPKSPEECIFARTTETISADLKTAITPCQFGGKPDCSQCGCFASMGLAAIGHYKLVGPLTAGHIFMASDRVGRGWRRVREKFRPTSVFQAQPAPFKILQE